MRHYHGPSDRSNFDNSSSTTYVSTWEQWEMGVTVGIGDWLRGGRQRLTRKTVPAVYDVEIEAGLVPDVPTSMRIDRKIEIDSWDVFWARRSRKGFSVPDDGFRAALEEDFRRYAGWLDRVFALLPPAHSFAGEKLSADQRLWSELVSRPLVNGVLDKVLARVLGESFWPAVPEEYQPRVRESFNRLSDERPTAPSREMSVDEATAVDIGNDKARRAEYARLTTWNSFWSMRQAPEPEPLAKRVFEQCVDDQARWLEMLLESVPPALRRPRPEPVVAILRSKLLESRADEASVIAARAHVISTYFWPCFGSQHADMAQAIIARFEAQRPAVSLETREQDAIPPEAMLSAQGGTHQTHSNHGGRDKESVDEGSATRGVLSSSNRLCDCPGCWARRASRGAVPPIEIELKRVFARLFVEKQLRDALYDDVPRKYVDVLRTRRLTSLSFTVDSDEATCWMSREASLRAIVGDLFDAQSPRPEKDYVEALSAYIVTVEDRVSALPEWSQAAVPSRGGGHTGP
ncbi:hypothetical protein GCM10009849_18650 [Sinomonas flava]|uniref:Uncharacterized protein n=1 Tax=Sinomonas flava TaxID=496857 RepID=A0ABN3BSS5_9MICC